MKPATALSDSELRTPSDWRASVGLRCARPKKDLIIAGSQQTGKKYAPTPILFLTLRAWF
jgi:hypothetical protein